jgi:glycosyltransferase involved in cell wall biosynthesis
VRIAFIVGDVVNISGGSNVIIEYATALERSGHAVTLFTRERCETARSSWHPSLARLRVRHVTEAGDEAFDFAFATWWLTFFDLFRVRSRVYGYLNQSLESRFHREPHYKLLNRCTYGLPLLMVTEARWLAEFIQGVQPAARVLYVRNGLSREYFPRATAVPRRVGPLRVLVEGPWAVPFKGVPETFGVLREAHEAGVEFEAGWLTSDAAGARPEIGDHAVEVHERVPIDRVRGVLGRYDVLLKLSHVEGMYGPPLEMFSQGGTAITYTVTGSDEYMVHGHNGLLVEPFNRRAIVGYLRILAADPAFLRRLRENALATAAAYPDWDASGAELEAALAALAATGWTNAEVRPALESLATIEARWLEEIWRNESVAGTVAGGVLGWARTVKGSRPYQIAKRLLPAQVRRKIRGRVERVFR